MDNTISIFNGNNHDVIFESPMPNDFTENNTIMSEHYLQFSLNHIDKFKLKRCDYIRYKNLRYALRLDYNPEELSNGGFKYDLKFEAPVMFWNDVIMFYTMQDYQEVSWVLYGTAEQFLQIAIDNINTQLNENWKIGIVDPVRTLKNLSFDGAFVFDSLTEIAEQFECEWYVDYDKKTLNLVYKYEHSDEVFLERENQLIEIQKTENTEVEYCNRLYAFGSTRNIPTNYRKISEDEVIDAIVQKKLRMPSLIGDYIDSSDDLKGKSVIPRIVTFEDVYPKRIGKITSLRTVEKKDDNGKPFIIYYFKDSELQFKSEYIIAGETLGLVFGENSWLYGRDFELSYNDKTEEFEIINIEEGENYVPNSILTPRIGDEYVLYGFDISLVSDQYVPEAEQELYERAKEYLTIMNKDNSTYTCKINPVYRFENDLDLALGQRVKLCSLIFPNGFHTSRVYGYRKYPITGLDEYVIGDDSDYKRLARIENEVETNKKESDVQYLELMKLANGQIKNVKALNYLKTALENETMIDKGLLLTTLIRLGAVVGGEWIERAGINGGAMTEDDVVAYFGGTIEDAITGLASIIFKLDGSGHLAKGNIAWDKEGNLIVKGRFESSSNGHKIIIDPEDPSIKFMQGDYILGIIEFVDGLGAGTSVPRIQFKNQVLGIGGSVSSQLYERITTIDSSGITVKGQLFGEDVLVNVSEAGVYLKKNNETIFGYGSSFSTESGASNWFKCQLPYYYQKRESGDWYIGQDGGIKITL